MSFLKALWNRLVAALSESGGAQQVYAFSRERGLLEASAGELRRNNESESPPLKLRYLQLDAQHKCVPTDWYVIGYDTFAIYTFLQLVNMQGEAAVVEDGGDLASPHKDVAGKGFLQTLFRDKGQEFTVDYSKDFDQPETTGLISFLRFKTWIGISTLGELIGLLAIIKTVSALFQRSVIDIFNLSRRSPGRGRGGSGGHGLVFNVTQASKLYVFSILMVVPNFLGVHYRVPFMTATLSAYQFSYL